MRGIARTISEKRRLGLFALLCAASFSQAALGVGISYTKAVYSLPLTLDPIKMNDTSSLVAGNLIYDGLLRFSPSLKLESALAESWSTSADGKTLTFVLRSNARFHNGEPVTAEDVAASLLRALSPQSEVGKYYDCIDLQAENGISAKDKRTIEIRLKQPFPPFLSVLAGATAKVLPRKLLSNPGFFDHPVGSGPFQFVGRSSSPRKEIVLKGFKEYYRGAPMLESLALLELPEADAVKAAEAGKVHDLANWPLTAKNEVFQHGRNVSSPVAATWIIGLNARKAPFLDLKVRRLFQRDLDSEGFRKTFYPDAAPARGYVPPGLPGFGVGPEKGLKMARKPSKEKIRLVIPQELARAEEMRKFLEKNLRAKGWNAQVDTVAWADLMAGYDKKTLQAFLVSMNMDYPDAEFLLRNFESSNPDNFSGLHNAELDRLLRRARTTQDRRKRETLYKRSIGIIAGEAVTVNLFYPRANYWTSNCVEGFEPNILSDVYIDYSRISLKAGCEGKVVQR